MQPLGLPPEQTQAPQQDYPRNGIRGLHEAGAGQVVVDETLGSEARQQPLRHALLQVQVHGIVREHPPASSNTTGRIGASRLHSASF